MSNKTSEYNEGFAWPDLTYNMTGMGADEKDHTTAHSAPYPYKLLDFDTHEIRVLILEYHTVRDSVIKCLLTTMSLIEPEPFYALSYCWGDRDVTRRILLQNGTAIVTESLWMALKAVRRHMKSLESHPVALRLWVDAVCINQNNSQERSQQVRNMRQIYSRAEEVFVWAGCGNNLSADLLINLSSLIDEISQVSTWPLVQTTLVEMLKNGSSDVSKAMTVFFKEPYWRRVWIIQEVTVASKVTILFNEYAFRWKKVTAVLSRLHSLKDLNRTTAEAINGAVHLLKFRDAYSGRNLINLFDALVWSRRALATDPRDKIFALLGLCHDGATFVPVPNYKQDLGKIIAEMSRMMMSLNKSLDCICLRGAGCSGSTEKLPSWAPNWPAIWSGKLTIQEENILSHPWTPHSDKLSLKLYGGSLRATGTYFGRVISLASAFTSPDWRSATTLPSGWILSTSTLREKQPELKVDEFGCAIQKVIWKTLIMAPRDSRSRSTYDQSPSEYHCCKLLWQPEGRGAVESFDLIKWIDNNASFKIGQWTLREWSQVRHKKEDTPLTPAKIFPSLFKRPTNTNLSRKTVTQTLNPSTMEWEYSTSGDLEALIRNLHEVLSSGMRLVCTDFDARCPVAMAHPDVEVGDEIFYLDGCKCPVILRRLGKFDYIGRKWVIGACHLVGVRVDNQFVIPGDNLNPSDSDAWSRPMHRVELGLV